MEFFETGYLESVGTKARLTKATSFKEKVRLVALSLHTVTVVLENNAIWFKGYSINYHFPND